MHTDRPSSSLSLAASTHPAVPPPTISTSYSVEASTWRTVTPNDIRDATELATIRYRSDLRAGACQLDQVLDRGVRTGSPSRPSTSAWTAQAGRPASRAGPRP